MGHAVGRVLRESGLDVVSCLSGRSARTQTLAAQAGIRDIPSLDLLVREADLILSILVPAEAVTAAERVAQAMASTGTTAVYADCNAIAPPTAQRIDTIITSAGGRFIDAGIIGGPPGPDEVTRFYASGPHEAVLGQLDGRGINVRQMGGEVGRASGIKMCYASLTKGTAALHAAVLTTAGSLGLSQELTAELEESQSAKLGEMQSVKSLSAKAFRWIGEMEEIAATYESAGVTPGFHLGAADVFRMIADSPIGHERPETIDKNRTLDQTVKIFVEGVRQARENR
jgi:3-hydroxyisobutyrate dehydrogenase-like beta-hydroxyacid dehydrogenase